MANKYEAETMYKVKLARPIKNGPSWLRPDQDVTLKGKICEVHDDAILEAVKSE